MFSKEPFRHGTTPGVSAALVAWPLEPATLQTALPPGLYAGRVGGPPWLVLGVVPRQLGVDRSIAALWSPVVGPADLLGAFVHAVWTEGPVNAWGARRWAGSNGGWARSSLSSAGHRPGAKIALTCRSRGLFHTEVPIRLNLTTPEADGDPQNADASPDDARLLCQQLLGSTMRLYRRDPSGLSCVRADIQLHHMSPATVAPRSTVATRGHIAAAPYSWARIRSSGPPPSAKDQPVGAIGRVSVELHPPFRMGTPVRARIPALFRLQRSPAPDPLAPASPHIQSNGQAGWLSEALHPPTVGTRG
ncbi:MAG: hypothetical protein KAZ88_07495 [Acidimicrobiia bacterium]|nr:hypothetical protein [Acidimicrobiia bacterium]MBP8180821.1 hypothetical protein [Acidimicrobiia bacterium]